MLAIYILGITGFLFAAVTYIFCRKRWHNFSVVDLFVLSTGISFGAYSLVEVFIQRDYMLTMQLDPLVMVMIMLHVLLSTALILSVLRATPEKYQREFRLHYLAQNWREIGGPQQILLLSIVIATIIYGYFKFGIVGYLRFGFMDKAEINTIAPYWYTSIQPFIPVLIYSSALSASAKISSKRADATTWIVLLTAIVLCMIYGRRQFFYLLLLSGIIWYLPRSNLFDLRNLKFFAVMFCVIIIFSNIYQTYRKDIFNTTVNPVESWNDISATTSNLQKRMGPWYLNYLIMDSGAMPMLGAFFMQSFINSVPRVFWSDKTVYNEDIMLAHHYKLPSTDYPNNPFSAVIADFWIMSVLVIPFIYLFIFNSAAYVLKKVSKFPLLYLLLSVMMLQFIMNIELSFYAEMIGLYKYGTVTVILYFIARSLIRFFQAGARGVSAHENSS